MPALQSRCHDGVQRIPRPTGAFHRDNGPPPSLPSRPAGTLPWRLEGEGGEKLSREAILQLKLSCLAQPEQLLGALPCPQVGGPLGGRACGWAQPSMHSPASPLRRMAPSPPRRPPYIPLALPSGSLPNPHPTHPAARPTPLVHQRNLSFPAPCGRWWFPLQPPRIPCPTPSSRAPLNCCTTKSCVFFNLLPAAGVGAELVPGGPEV